MGFGVVVVGVFCLFVFEGCVCVCACACVCTLESLCARGGQILMWIIFLSHSLPYFLRWSQPLTLDLRLGQFGVILVWLISCFTLAISFYSVEPDLGH